MKYNVCFDILSAVVLAVLLSFNFTIPKKKKRLWRIYNGLVGSALITCVSDAGSAYFIEHIYDSDAGFVMAVILTYIYYAIQVTFAYMVMIYVYTYLTDKKEYSIRPYVLFMIPLAVCLLLLASNPFTDVMFALSRTEGFLKGSGVFGYYLVSAFYAIGTLFVAVLYKNKGKFGKVLTRVVFCCSAIIGGSLVVQYYYEKQLVICSAMMITALMLNLSLEYADLMNYTVNREKSHQRQRLVEGMATLIEDRDTSTGKHVIKTRRYATLIVNEMLDRKMHPDTVNSKFARYVSETAPLHDIGKITIPDSVLNKPGKFTPEEYEVMKTHTVNGGRIVADLLVDDFDLEMRHIAYEIASYHHERWDGKGYPLGLSGEDIPLSARIMAVADVFDAMISERVYKQAKSVDEAFKVIEEEAGKQFDPEISKLFVELRPQIEEMLRKDARQK